jgi:hypothetical protein
MSLFKKAAARAKTLAAAFFMEKLLYKSIRVWLTEEYGSVALSRQIPIFRIPKIKSGGVTICILNKRIRIRERASAGQARFRCGCSFIPENIWHRRGGFAAKVPLAGAFGGKTAARKTAPLNKSVFQNIGGCATGTN